MAFAEAHFGILTAGAISVPCDTAVTAANLTQICSSCRPRAIITNPAIWRRLSEECQGLEVLETVVFLEPTELEVGSLRREIIAEGERRRSVELSSQSVSESDVATLMYTTGTTGGAKGVPLTHRNIFAALTNIISFIGYSESDREVVILPWSHNFGLGHLYCNLISGGAVYTENGMARVGRVLKQLSAFGATGFPGTPTGIGILLDKYSEIFREHGSQLRFSVINSAPLPPDRTKQLHALLPNLDILVYYGLTEASRSTFISLSSEGPDYYRSVGPAMNQVDVQIRDNQGEALGTGEVGEVFISGPTVTSGYWENPELNKVSFVEGALRTGDLGYNDSEGFLFITGRIKDVINVGGYKVFPGEVEEVINEFPGIADSGVAGTKQDGVTGEIVAAAIVPEAGEVDLDALAKHCQQRLEGFKVPKLFRVIALIPSSNTGKAKRHEIRKLFEPESPAED